MAGSVQYGREGEGNVNEGEGTGIAGLEGPTVSVVEPAAREKRPRGPNETVILMLFFLGSLAAVGLLTDDEFEAKKADILREL
jgi:hypothetical protein